MAALVASSCGPAGSSRNGCSSLATDVVGAPSWLRRSWRLPLVSLVALRSSPVLMLLDLGTEIRGTSTHRGGAISSVFIGLPAIRRRACWAPCGLVTCGAVGSGHRTPGCWAPCGLVTCGAVGSGHRTPGCWAPCGLVTCGAVGSGHRTPGCWAPCGWSAVRLPAGLEGGGAPRVERGIALRLRPGVPAGTAGSRYRLRIVTRAGR
jgi:hypothetical protein